MNDVTPHTPIPVPVPPATGHQAMLAHVHVRVGACDIVIPIDQVHQALPLPSQGLTALPRRTGALLGVADVAGMAVPIVALERWLPLAVDANQTSAQRLLVLKHAGALVGMRVDAVLGVKGVLARDMRRIHHAADDNELFDAVVPATAVEPTLCILEVARLMRLSQAWYEAAELAPACAAETGNDAETTNETSRRAKHAASGTVRYAVFLIGTEQWAAPIAAVQRVVPVPTIELALSPTQRSWAICQWQGRKLPLVDVSEGRQASDSQTAPWTVLLCHGPLVLGLTVAACQQFVDLGPDAVAPTPDDALMAGVALLPELGKLQILDVAKLFAMTPEASVSRQSAQPSDDTSPSHVAEPLPYLVFDADQRYATPVQGIWGVVELPPAARDDLRQGRRAVLAWRGRTVQVINLPAIARSAGQADPLLAVLVQAPGDTDAPIGIAIRSLADWLPAHSARRSGLSLGAMGEMGLINARGAVDHENLVEVDLAQMAYLLG